MTVSGSPLDPFLIPGSGLAPANVAETDHTRVDTQDIRDETILTEDIADTQITPAKAVLSSATNWVFQGGLSGSIQRTSNGISYLAAGNAITVVSAANGQITIAADAAAPTDAQYLVLALDGGLSDERVLTAGTGIDSSDGGANGNFTISIDDSVVATVSGTRFVNNIEVVGTASFQSGLSGSLTQLTDGSSYLIAGTNVDITSASNGAITIGLGSLDGIAGFDDFVFGDVPTGVIDGANTIYTSSQLPVPNESIVVWKNGIRMESGSANDYTFQVSGGLGLVTFEAGQVPTTDSVIMFDYLLKP